MRQPSMGPTFGIKGGAAGGGYSQVRYLSCLYAVILSWAAIYNAIVNKLLVESGNACFANVPRETCIQWLLFSC